jgi:hypothetical protein
MIHLKEPKTEVASVHLKSTLNRLPSKVVLKYIPFNPISLPIIKGMAWDVGPEIDRTVCVFRKRR